MNDIFQFLGGWFFVIAVGLGVVVLIFGGFWLCVSIVTVLLEACVKQMRYSAELMRFMMSRHKKERDEDNEFFRKLWEE